MTSTTSSLAYLNIKVDLFNFGPNFLLNVSSTSYKRYQHTSCRILGRRPRRQGGQERGRRQKGTYMRSFVGS